MRDQEFENLIYEFIKAHEAENVNSVDIGCGILPYDNCDMEDVMNALARLENDVLIARVPSGIRYKYITI